MSFYEMFSWTTENGELLINEESPLDFRLDYTLESNDFYKLKISNALYEDCSIEEKVLLSETNILDSLQYDFFQGIERQKTKVQLDLFPFVKKDGIVKKLVFAQFDFLPNEISEKSRKMSVSNQINGDCYKVSLTSNGIYKITYQNLIDLGVDVEQINPKKISIYGKSGGMLDENNIHDLVFGPEELSIEVVGEQDGSFDANDYILFYGQGPNQWLYNEQENDFNYNNHFYENTSYYYINVNSNDGKRINTLENQDSFDKIITSFNDFKIYAPEEVNFVKSGRNWFGDHFSLVSNRSYNFNFPNKLSQAELEVKLAGRSSSPAVNQFQITATGSGSENIIIPNVISSYVYANLKVYNKSLSTSSSSISVSINHVNSSNSEGWLDYVKVSADRSLVMSGSQMSFRSKESVEENSISKFQLENSSSITRIWDVSNALEPKSVVTNFLNNQLSFNALTNDLKEFIAFDNNFKSVNLIGKIEKKNLLTSENFDFLIVSHPNFLFEAERLAQFHRDFDNLLVKVVTPQEIYEEFSAGKQDPSAIRNYARFLYEQENSSFRYLLLFGDASYDPKDRIQNNTNYIVSYQSSNSSSFLESYVTDDFFAILDAGESLTSFNNILPFLDIGVGRFPVKSLAEAQNAVDKILDYHDEESFGSWKLDMTFVGDDNDVAETSHSTQAEILSDYVKQTHPFVNINKIYLDAYEQENSSGGQRCPLVNEAINKQINKGTFVINYNGHGGELGWAHERILGLEDIASWDNRHKLPLFMTATCEFGRYDDPERDSAGEEVFLKENGGAIALLTTSRIVYTGGNMDLNESFLEYLFPEDSNDGKRLGDIVRLTKNNVPNVLSTNHRNFTLLGDPALRLAYPKLEIVLDDIQDTAQALGLITMNGKIIAEGVVQENFNGYVYPAVFDKSIDYQTLQQDESPLIVFDLQNSSLFRGFSRVEDGRFSFSFIVPKDINYDFGNGKISLYAKGTMNNQAIDAMGADYNLIIGGTANDFAEDSSGPEVRLFMNDTSFVDGGMTNENPSLLALLSDKNGINSVSNSIGHDLVAVLDDDNSKPIELSAFYQADLDSYTNGSVLYPFSNLDEGRHTLKLKVWDVFNNSSESEIDFYVLKSQELSIQNLINYPNPVVDFTSFFFEHNQANDPLDVTLMIYDLSGKLIFELNEIITPTGFKYGPIRWDARSNNGYKLNSGTYVYTIIAKASNDKFQQESGRLILIN